MTELASRLGIELREADTSVPCRECGRIHTGLCKDERGLTAQVRDILPGLEFEQFRQPERREELNEIRALARQQVNDDTYNSVAERHGAGGVHAVFRQDRDPGDDTQEMWTQRTESDRALAAALEPLLDMALTAEQRSLVRLRYDAQESFDEIATRLNITKRSVQDRYQVINKRIKEALLKVFGEGPEVADAQDD